MVLARFAAPAVFVAALWAPSSSLALALDAGTAPAPLTPFKPAATATTSGALTVTALAGWTLAVSDASASAAPGHLLRAPACTQGVASLAQPLSITATTTLPGSTSAGAVSLSGSTQNVLTGVGTGLVTAAYSQTIGAGEALLAGCVYTVTVTFTLS